jgi:hypothetical protein
MVFFTAGAGTTLSLIEVWDGPGHTFTADGLTTRRTLPIKMPLLSQASLIQAEV